MLLDILAVLELWDEPPAPPGGGGGSFVAILWPNGPGALTEWTPSSGTNWQAATAFGGAVLSAAVAGIRDRYTIEDLPGAAVSINSVTAHAFIGAGGATSACRMVLELSGTDSNGANFNPAEGSYNTASTAFALAPGGLPWTVARVNALTAGVETVDPPDAGITLDAFWLAVNYSVTAPATDRPPRVVLFDDTAGVTIGAETDPVIPFTRRDVSLDWPPISVDLSHAGDAPQALDMDAEEF